MKTWTAALGLAVCFCVLAFGRPSASSSLANMTEDDFRKLEQNWLDAAAAPDLPALRTMLSDDFMGTAFGGEVLSKLDVVPTSGSSPNHMPKCSLRDSTVRVFGDTAVLMGYVEMQAPQKKQGMRMTTVFQKRAEAWQVIAVHMSRTPEGAE
jgi:ketosteroid isomerase-like protein